jgi:hypothetical protein
MMSAPHFLAYSSSPAGMVMRQASRAGAHGHDDYDVIGKDGTIIGRIFKAITSPVGTAWTWAVVETSPGSNIYAWI